MTVSPTARPDSWHSVFGMVDWSSKTAMLTFDKRGSQPLVARFSADWTRLTIPTVTGSKVWLR